MAENNDEDLIGFDPLAWIREESVTDTAVEAPEQINASPAELPEANAPSDETTDIAPQPTRIELGESQAIQSVADLHLTLLKALEQSDCIEIDASAIQQIDTASLQLLLVAKRSAISQHKTLSIDFPSERFIEAATLLGLAEILEVDQAAAGFF